MSHILIVAKDVVVFAVTLFLSFCLGGMDYALLRLFLKSRPLRMGAYTITGLVSTIFVTAAALVLYVGMRSVLSTGWQTPNLVTSALFYLLGVSLFWYSYKQYSKTMAA